MIVIGFFLWTSVLCLLHSYLLYPLLLKWLTKNKPNNSLVYNKQETLPSVVFLMSLYNEEKVIVQKLNSLLASDYPRDKLSVYIGSDCSEDQTNTLVEAFIAEHAWMHFFPYQTRSGKPGVINRLVRSATENSSSKGEEPILIISDANVMLAPNTIFELVKHFKNKAIGLVDSNIQNPHKKHTDAIGIAQS